MSNSEERKTLRVTNLHKSVDEAAITDHFSQFGKVIFVKLKPGSTPPFRGRAHVTFDTHSEGFSSFWISHIFFIKLLMLW